MSNKSKKYQKGYDDFMKGKGKNENLEFDEDYLAGYNRAIFDSSHGFDFRYD